MNKSGQLDAMVRDFTELGKCSKSEVRRRILEFAAPPVDVLPPNCGECNQPILKGRQLCGADRKGGGIYCVPAPPVEEIGPEGGAAPTEPDNCQICHGRQGGVKGNENVINGVVMCDYCHADQMNLTAGEPIGSFEGRIPAPQPETGWTELPRKMLCSNCGDFVIFKTDGEVINIFHVCKPSSLPVATPSAPSELNQCDGCNLGLPLDDKGNHLRDGAVFGIHQSCTKFKYQASAPTGAELPDLKLVSSSDVGALAYRAGDVEKFKRAALQQIAAKQRMIEEAVEKLKETQTTRNLMAKNNLEREAISLLTQDGGTK